MKSLNFVIIKLTLCLILGILLNYYIHISLLQTIYYTCTLSIVLFVLYQIALQQFIKSIWFGIISLMSMVSIGMLVENIHEQHHLKNHYTNSKSFKENSNEQSVTIRIREVLKSGNYYDKYIIDVLKIDKKRTSGKSLLNIAQDSLKNSLAVDAIYVIKSSIKNIPEPLNPNQFDYKSYLKKKYIYHQIHTNTSSLYLVSQKKHTLFGYADKLRQQINKKLKNYNFKDDELAIINALLLGQRQDVTENLYTNYANAGAIHILAVSGLHVGIVLMLLNVVFKPLEQLRHGRYYKAIVLITLLWGFAIVAGLSASVTRAVGMFSIVAIGLNLKRPTNIYNTLGISMFFILLCKPMFIFDVGFQMSYLAVIAIVSIQPLLYKMWLPKIKLIDKLWQIFTVTLAAQFGVVPISLFYFHQFPGLFFISNLVIIPFLGFILGFGIIIILLALFGILPTFLAESYGKIISTMNDFVGWISLQEEFIFKDISFGIIHVLSSYILIFTVTRLLKKTNAIRLIYVVISILIIQLSFIFDSYKTSQENSFTIFHKSRHTILGFKMNTHLILYHDMDSLKILKDKTLLNYKVSNSIKKMSEDTLKSVYRINNDNLLVIDSLGIYAVKSFKPDYVLLRQSPRINLKRLIDSIQPKTIIADGSNYKSYIQRWEETCKKEKLPFHQTGKKGAFIIKY